MRVHTLNYAVGNGSTSLIFTLTWFSLIIQRKMLIIVIICLITPLLIACFSYLLIWREKRKRTLRSFRQNQEARFSRTIFLATAASFIAWIPFLYFNLELYMATSMPRLIPLTAFFFIKLLHFSNSFVNFIIYIVRFPIATEKLCFLYVDPIVSCESTHQLGTSRPSMHRQPHFSGHLNVLEYSNLFLPMKSDVFLNFRSMENVLSYLNGTSLKLIDI